MSGDSLPEQRSPMPALAESVLHDLVRDRAAHGLPPTIEDPAVLAKVAAIVLGDGPWHPSASPKRTQSGEAGET